MAVLMVFCQHYINEPEALHWGWAGVDFFFVLSGFLITGILYDTRNTVHRFRNFYVRRTLRIFPLYYAIFFLALLSTPIFHWVWYRGWYLWPVYLGNYARFLFLGKFLNDQDLFDTLRSTLPVTPRFALLIGHFWSLCVEEQFYLVWPFVVYFIKDRVRLRNLCLGVVLITPLLRLLCVFILPTDLLKADLLYRFTPLRIDALLLGAFVALCLRGPESNRIARLGRPVVVSVSLVFALIVAASFLFTHHAPSPDARVPWICTIGFTLIDFFAAGLILLSLNPRSFVYRLFTLSWLRRLGQMSYGFYIFHLLLRMAYFHMALRIFGSNARHINLPVAIIAFFCTLLISYLSFRFFEAPFLRLKDRFTA
jgi:peptidoglycan/LPS O-acetylase OafA/YrhL